MTHLQKSSRPISKAFYINIQKDSEEGLCLTYSEPLKQTLISMSPFWLIILVAAFLAPSPIAVILLGLIAGMSILHYLSKLIFRLRVKVVGTQALIWGPILHRTSPRIVSLENLLTITASKTLYLLTIRRTTGTSRIFLHTTGYNAGKGPSALVGDYLLEQVDGVIRLSTTEAQ